VPSIAEGAIEQKAIGAWKDAPSPQQARQFVFIFVLPTFAERC
jgi:hypothetical protein